MTCDACGARNPEGAQWCNQCFETLDSTDAEPAETAAEPFEDLSQPDQTSLAGEDVVDPGREPATAVAASRPNTTTEAAGEVSQDGHLEGGFRRRGEKVEWACPACGEFASVDTFACPVCGTTLAERFEDDTGQEPSTPLGTALAMTVVLPGAGHISQKHLGSGIARALLYVLWMGGGLMMLTAYGAQGATVAAPMLLGAVVIWGGSLADTYALESGNRQVIAGRLLLWLVVAVTGLAMIGAVGTTGSAVTLS